MQSEEMELKIRSDQHVRELHHEVRIFTKQKNAFDIVHNERGLIFGAEEDYGSKAWWETSNKKLCNLRVRTGDVITQVVRAPRPELDLTEYTDEVTQSMLALALASDCE